MILARINARPNEFVEDKDKINGIPSDLTMKTNDCGDFCTLQETTDNFALITEVHLQNFPPGSEIVHVD